MQFIDEVKIAVQAGDGGDGAIAFRRAKHQPKGGPAGGDGGRGGSVVFEADNNVGTLLDLKYRHRIEAQRGQNGGGKDCHGKGAQDTIIRVPVGTVITDQITGEQVGDLISHGQCLVVAQGGRGGLGNMHFATASNQAPRKSQPGEPGEMREVRLELKLLADVGLVGLPSVGKSSLIAAMSAAKPKIASYPFTTLTPNLGVVELGPGSSFVMADIPGLVEGASEGAGLGHRFLRHIQRTAVLLHVVALDDTMENDPFEDYLTLKRELDAYDPQLATRPAFVVLNKADLPLTREVESPLRARFDGLGLTLVTCSAATRQGLDGLIAAISEILAERERQRVRQEAQAAREALLDPVEPSSSVADGGPADEEPI